MYKARIQELEQELQRKLTSKKSTKKGGEPVGPKHFERYVKHIAKFIQELNSFPVIKCLMTLKNKFYW